MWSTWLAPPTWKLSMRGISVYWRSRSGGMLMLPPDPDDLETHKPSRSSCCPAVRVGRTDSAAANRGAQAGSVSRLVLALVRIKPVLLTKL
jgi:hypothetical protein